MKRFASLVFVTLAVLTGVPANAESDPPWPLVPRDSPCTVGQLDADSANIRPSNDPLRFLVTIRGVLECGVPEPGPKFAVAFYESAEMGSGYVTPPSIRDYSRSEGPTEFKVPALIKAGTGMCLIPYDEVRLSCVRLVGSGESMTVTAVPPEDAFFDGPITLRKDWESSPECPSCW